MIVPRTQSGVYAAGVAERVARAAGARTRRRIEQGMPDLARRATARMEATLPSYRGLSAEDRPGGGLVAQAGIGAFLTWFRDPGGVLEITADVFGTAPRELTRSVT